MTWLACPKCNTKTTVTDTRASAIYVRRRHRCLNPIEPHRFSTVEVLTPAGVTAAQVANTVQPLVDFLKGIKSWQKKR